MPLPLLALAWLLLPVMTIGATQVGTVPGDLPMVALAAGPAVVVSMRARQATTWRTWLALCAVLAVSEWLAQWIGQPHGLNPAQRLIGALGAGVLVSAQAVLSARRVDRVWDELVLDRRPPALRRVAAMTRMIAMGVVPLAIVAAAGLSLLQGLLHAMTSGAGWVAGLNPWALPLANHALASSLSVLVLVPMLRSDRWPWPAWPVVAGVLLAGPLLALCVVAWPDWLVVLPAYTFLAGWLGGLSGAALATALSVGLMVLLGEVHAGHSPFDGPDGYTVLLATSVRLALVGMLGMVWNEPRARRRQRREGADARSGAATFRNVMALEWQLARTGYGRGQNVDRPVLWLHIDLPVYRPPGSRSALSPLSMADDGSMTQGAEPAIQRMMAGPIGRLTGAPATAAGDTATSPAGDGQVLDDGLDSTLPSPRLPALMLALARGLRGHDAVVPIAGEALIVLVNDIDRSVVGKLVNRLDVLLLQEGRRHLAPADIRQAALVHASAATVLLTSARYLSTDL
ncbi:hypothetical protein [Sphaerotilus mobilis]|uniref:Uncharacterized protein n=1 Tax=Sphaerotilus mobilis TaxID=47994 RepID=A0A4V2EX52_9BURK|nr:hypothetical protein [Sphaerotilus mobilis]RZS58280.1 hypothetical protein EV685_0564 [Sphaerotilus mobilis]